MKSEITPLHNYVFFKVEKEKEDIIELKNGVLFLATQFEPKKHARIYGEVIGVPRKLTGEVMWREEDGYPVTFYSGEMAQQMALILKAGQFYTPEEEREEDIRIRRQLYDPSTHEPTYKTLADIVPEVLQGDRIYFHFNTVKEENRIQTASGETIYKVRYDQIFCAVRDGKIIPIGGWVLIHAEWGEGVEEILLQGNEKIRGKLSPSGLVVELNEKPKPLQGIVAHIGTPLKGDPELGLKPGDPIYFLPLSGDFINTIEGTRYCIMRQKDLISVR